MEAAGRSNWGDNWRQGIEKGEIMRKLSYKLPVLLTLFAFMQALAYVAVRIRTLELFHASDFAKRVLGGTVISIVIWFIYGIVCLLTPRRKN